MTDKILTITFAITALQITAPPASADLPTRAELQKESHEEDPAKGIIALNRRYIESFQTELNSLLEAKKLEEANVVQTQIQALQTEIQKLGAEREKAKSMTGVKSGEAPAKFLIGKTLESPKRAMPTNSPSATPAKPINAVWCPRSRNRRHRICRRCLRLSSFAASDSGCKEQR